MNLYKLIGPLFSMAMVSGLAQTSQSPSSCEMAPAVRQALNNLPNAWDARIPLEERMKPVRALLEKYPRDLFVQQRYQDMFRGHTDLYKEFDAAFALYRARPDDPTLRYLEARLTAGFHRPKAEEMLNDLIARQPDFPWPHLAIAEMTDRSGARDAKKAEPHLRAFLAACPSSVEGYALLRTAEDPEMIREGAAKLRPLLEAQGDYVSWPYWRYLWDLEFRAAPKEQQETVRQRVLKDAESLKKLPPAPSREWFQILDYAANLTKDQDLRSWLEETVLQKFPGFLARGERGADAMVARAPPPRAGSQTGGTEGLCQPVPRAAGGTRQALPG